MPNIHLIRNMSEEDFISSIDANFPFEEKLAVEVMEVANSISDNACYYVLFEICCLPLSKKISPETQLEFLCLWRDRCHPKMKDVGLQTAQSIIKGIPQSYEFISQNMKKLCEFTNQFSLLDLLEISGVDHYLEMASDSQAVVDYWNNLKNHEI